MNSSTWVVLFCSVLKWRILSTVVLGLAVTISRTECWGGGRMSADDDVWDVDHANRRGGKNKERIEGNPTQPQHGRTTRG